MRFRVCRDQKQRRWIVLLGDRQYREYLNQQTAILDAIETAKEIREGGEAIEVWHQSARVY